MGSVCSVYRELEGPTLVSLAGPDLLAARRQQLESHLIASFGSASLHSQAFAIRVLGAPLLRRVVGEPNLDFDLDQGDLSYGGYPRLAYLGFGIGSVKDLPHHVTGTFRKGVERLMNRTDTSLKALLSDDIGILGIADGLAHAPDDDALNEARGWLSRLIDRSSPSEEWSIRLRLLAGDLLDERGRLNARPHSAEVDVLALELVGRTVWPSSFRLTPALGDDERLKVLNALLSDMPPAAGDL